MEFIDQHPVVSYRVRFKDRAEITDEAAAAVKDGNVIHWLVRARCQPPSYHPVTKDAEERYRFNVQEVESVLPLQGSAADAAVAFMAHGEVQGYLNLGAARYPDPDGAIEELAQIRELLVEAGIEDSPVEYLRKTLPAATVIEEDHPRPLVDVLAEPSTNGVEVVGSIYRGGRSETYDLLDAMFGDRP